MDKKNNEVKSALNARKRQWFNVRKICTPCLHKVANHTLICWNLTKMENRNFNFPFLSRNRLQQVRNLMDSLQLFNLIIMRFELRNYANFLGLSCTKEVV